MNFVDIELQILQRADAAFVPSGRFAVADMVLKSFVHELYQNARVVSMVHRSTTPERAAPNARATFEAAQNALLLVSHADYAYAGALAWAYHLLQDDSIVFSFEKLYGELPPKDRQNDDGDEITLARSLHEIERLSAEYGPENRGKVLRAHEEIVRRRGVADNWIGANVAASLASQLPAFAPPQWRERVSDPEWWRVGFAWLCRDTHTRTRLRPKWIRGAVNGALTFEYEPDDYTTVADTVLKMTAASVQLGVVSLGIRHGRFAAI